MKISKSNYFKVFFFGLFSIFIFLNSLNLVSAVASFTDIPDQLFEYNYYREINLYDYCSTCVQNGFAVQFINPDTNQQVTLFGDTGGEHTNSYFTITLTEYGLLQMISNFQDVEVSVVVYGSDTAFQSQTSDSFKINIKENQKPVQIASFYNPTLVGNQSFGYSMNGFFLNYDTITVNYHDFTLDTTVNLQKNKSLTGAFSCSNGDLRVCLGQSGEDVSLTLTGLNKTITNKTIVITASNSFGSTIETTGGIRVNTQSTAPYSSAPVRLPLSLAPFNLDFFDGEEKNLSQFWSNATYYNVTFAYAVNSTNVTLSSISGGDYFTSSYFSLILAQDRIYISSKDQQLNHSVYLTACNEAGCNNTLGRLDFSVLGRIPTQLFDLPPIFLSYGDVYSFNLRDYYTGNITSYRFAIQAYDNNTNLGSYDFVISNTTSNVSINLTAGAGIRGMSVQNDGVVNIYSGNTTYNNISSIHYKYTTSTCNAFGCRGSITSFNISTNASSAFYSNVIIIGNDVNQYGEDLQGLSSINSPLWKTIVLSWSNIFLPADELANNSKYLYAIVVMVLVSMLTFFFMFKAGASASMFLIAVGVINFFLLLYFTIKGFVSPFILGSITIIALILTATKLFKSGE